GALRAQAAKRGLKPGVDVVQVPAKALDLRGALANQVLAMIEQELDLARGGVEMGDRELRFPERSPGYRERVDRIGLAELAGRAPCSRHQLWRHPDHPLAPGDQLPLEPPGDVAAVLQGELALGAEVPGPCEQALVAGAVAGDRHLVAKLAGRRIHRRRRMALLMGVDADRDHLLRSSYAGLV